MNFDLDDELANKALLHRISLNIYETFGIEEGYNIIDEHLPLVKEYPHDIFIDYLNDSTRELEEKYETKIRKCGGSFKKTVERVLDAHEMYSSRYD
ncbi:hypothetical protein [Vibrio sp. ER1A]|uniref:hypothetical protein n=1 Tax=Vibrio sp. ER1A TaxID=1517681 RepID=UPI00056F1CF2|nr:hypothetical protein [Vibrio sp. ER1A]